MMLRSITIALEIVGVCLFTGCPESGTLCPPRVDIDAAADVLEIDGKHYVLECYLWRDQMPPVPLGGKPLIVNVRLTEVDSLEVAPGIDMTYVWVLWMGLAWGNELSGEGRPPRPPYQIERVAGGGPKWGSPVDIVVRVVDGAGNTYLVRSLNVPVEVVF